MLIISLTFIFGAKVLLFLHFGKPMGARFAFCTKFGGHKVLVLACPRGDKRPSIAWADYFTLTILIPNCVG